MKYFDWNVEKNAKRRTERGMVFEDAVMKLSKDEKELLDSEKAYRDMPPRFWDFGTYILMIS